MLTITNYIKQYPGTAGPVLVINELTAEKGIYWIKGENGSGKTSLFKSVAGLIPFKGEIAVNGIDIIKKRMEYTSLVNYAEAEPLYPAFLSGKDLINFYTNTKGANFPTDLFNNLGVEKFMHQKTAVYSSGMMKKLSLVLAFIGSARWILLDEPLITIDANAVEVVCGMIRESCHKGVSFIITSHQLLHASQLAFSGTMVADNKTINISA